MIGEPYPGAAHGGLALADGAQAAGFGAGGGAGGALHGADLWLDTGRGEGDHR